MNAVQVRRFGGLRATSDPADVGLEAATDLLNVEVSPDRSQVMSRPGCESIGSVGALAGTPQCLGDVVFTGTYNYLLPVGLTDLGNVFIDRVGTNGSRVALASYTPAYVATSPVNAVQFGVPGSADAFVAYEGTAMRKVAGVDGTTVSTSVGKPRWIGVTPVSNRLVQAGFNAAADTPSGADGTSSTVFFSDAGDPETFTATNFVQLGAGDGEVFHGVHSFRNQLFVFRESSFYVFYGESTDSTGNTVFNYRAERLPTGIVSPPPEYTGAAHRTAVGSRGVYYVAPDGVYVTSGGEPVKVSSDLDGQFDGVEGWSNVVLGCANERVFFVYASTGYMYVLDERSGQWSRWLFDTASKVILAPPVAWNSGQSFGRPMVFAAGASLYEMRDGVEGDPVSGEVDAFYESGVSDLGAPGLKVVRQSEVWGVIPGSGALTFRMKSEYGYPDTGWSVSVGTTAGRGVDRTARRGRKLGFRVDSSEQFELYEVGLFVREVSVR